MKTFFIFFFVTYCYFGVHADDSRVVVCPRQIDNGDTSPQPLPCKDINERWSFDYRYYEWCTRPNIICPPIKTRGCFCRAGWCRDNATGKCKLRTLDPAPATLAEVQ